MGYLRSLLRAIVRGTAYGCAVVTFADVVGHPARVQGSSMLPTLRGDVGDRDIVWLSTWDTTPVPGAIMTFTSPRDPRTVLIKRCTATEHGLVRRPDGEPFIIPEGQCWMESDNEANRNDSNVFGPVSEGLIHARATRIIWPLARWKTL